MTKGPIPHDQILKFMNQEIAFNRFLGIVVTKLAHGFTRMELRYRDEFLGDPVRPGGDAPKDRLTT